MSLAFVTITDSFGFSGIFSSVKSPKSALETDS